MQKNKVIKGRFAAAAISAMLAAAAVGGEIIPAAMSFPAIAAEEQSAVSETADGVTLNMSLTAGGSKIGVSYYLTTEENISGYTFFLDGTEQTPDSTENGLLITAEENAMNMNNTHTLTVKKGGNVVREWNVSVKDYLSKLLAKSELSDYHDIAAKMLRYGGAAQNFFGVDTDNLADKEVTGADYSGVEVNSDVFNKDGLNAQLASAPVTYYGMNLSLRSEIRFTLYFKASEVSAGKEFLNGFTFGEKQVDAVSAGGDFLAVSIDVPASNLTDAYTFENGTISAEVSPVQYIAAAVTQENEELVNVCKALYAYGESARELKEKQNVNDPQWLLEAKGTVHSGKGTYYDLTDSNLGNAMLNDVRGEHYYAAMNTADYNTAMLAGAYVEVTGPNGSVDVYVVDRLPEGKVGDIDLDPQAFEKIANKIDGRVPITWKIIPFDNAADKNISYRFKNNDYNPYFSEIQVLDHKYPIYSLEVLKGGEFVNVERQEYNYFKDASGFGAGPYTFRITDIYGHVIVDENVDLSSGTANGNVQFPD